VRKPGRFREASSKGMRCKKETQIHIGETKQLSGSIDFVIVRRVDR